MATPDDPLELARALIRCPSVTPEDAGALDVLEGALDDLGFTCTRLVFGEKEGERVDNLYARLGDGRPLFCFAGHTDVVPVGEPAQWSLDPFAAEVDGARLFGRGAADMKGAIACFVAATARFTQNHAQGLPGTISLLITGDEEGEAVNGTAKVLDWMAQNDEIPDACLVGEPTNPRRLGEMIKIGRRGSLYARLTVRGAQGHVAYPHLADNPIPRLMTMLERVRGEMDGGCDHFQPSNLEITSIDVGNPASNVIPASASARFSIRYNPGHTPLSIERWLRENFDAVGGAYELALTATGDAFLTPPGPLSELVAGAVESVLGTRPELSTTGGTSDARFIKDYCPVCEFGLVGQTMHKVDEHVLLADLGALTDIYTAVLAGFFAAGRTE